MEGFKQYKVIYNQKNTRCARNNPCGSYLMALEVYTATKSSGMSLRDMGGLSFQDFMMSGSVVACCRLKCLSLAPYYAAQMKKCTQKWDRQDNQGAGTKAVDFCQQLVV